MCIMCEIADNLPTSEKEKIALKLKVEIDQRLMVLKGLGYEFNIVRGDND